MHGRPDALNRAGEGVCRPALAPTGKFGRMFPGLEPVCACPEALKALAATMVEQDGVASRDIPALPAGYTFLGQFIDHDITFDPTSLSETTADPEALTNYRTPAIDLDNLYGRGPAVDPQYYSSGHGAELFLLGETQKTDTLPAMFLDLPRQTLNSRALIPDPRNDENLAIAQLHVLMLYFHNAVLAGLQSGDIKEGVSFKKSLFAHAREIVISHYQQIVFTEFLPAIVDERVLDRVLCRGSSVFRDRGVFMPVEFSSAAYRFGHSIVRETYEINNIFCGSNALHLGQMFLHAAGGTRAPMVPVPSNQIVDWRRFFRIDDAVPTCASRSIDPYLAPELGRLQLPSGDANLAEMNLERGMKLQLPAGQDVARYYGYDPLSPDRIKDSGPDGVAAAKWDLHVRSPLWYYVLKEAQLEADGRNLGPVGSRIVCETLIGLLDCDGRLPEHIRQPTPTLKSGPFKMADLIALAETQFDGGKFPDLG